MTIIYRADIYYNKITGTQVFGKFGVVGKLLKKCILLVHCLVPKCKDNLLQNYLRASVTVTSLSSATTLLNVGELQFVERQLILVRHNIIVLFFVVTLKI